MLLISIYLDFIFMFLDFFYYVWMDVLIIYLYFIIIFFAFFLATHIIILFFVLINLSRKYTLFYIFLQIITFQIRYDTPGKQCMLLISF